MKRRSPTKPVPPATDATIARFVVKIGIGDPEVCWPWLGGFFNNGYGCFSIGGNSFKAHRVAKAWLGSEYPPTDKVVMHACDTPSCCNPRHLAIGTDADNVRDRDAKGRHNPARGDNSGSRKHPERRAFGDSNPSRRFPERLRWGPSHPFRLDPNRVSHGEGKATKLTARAACEIFLDPRPLQEIASTHGITKQLASQIKHRKCWRRATSHLAAKPTTDNAA